MAPPRNGAKGYELEEILKSYFWQAGYFAVRGVPFRIEDEDVTDIDIWLYERPAASTRRRMIVDVKNKRSPKASERVIWTAGLQKALGVDGAIVATTDRRLATRRLAKALPEAGGVEVWLGESKLYTNPGRAVSDAVKSILAHIDQGFLTNEKTLLGPQIPKSSPGYSELMTLFDKNTSIDKLMANAVFAIGIVCKSKAAIEAKLHDSAYLKAVHAEMTSLSGKLSASGICSKVRVVLIYIPIPDKKVLVDAFDARLKGLQ